MAKEKPLKQRLLDKIADANSEEEVQLLRYKISVLDELEE